MSLQACTKPIGIPCDKKGHTEYLFLCFISKPSCSAAGSSWAEPTWVPDLGQLRPQLQSEWHPQKNKHLATAQQNPFSFARAVWRCPDCYNEWQARIIDRAYNEAGCPQCAHRESCAGESDLPFLSQWDHVNNGLMGIFPDQVSLNSHKKVFWVCIKCPQKWPHEWQQSPFDRVQHPHSCCPHCDGKQACICNNAPRRI